jgi:hypothetical protein
LNVRLPDRTTKALSTYDKKLLAAHGALESFWVQEFKIQYVTEWEVGHELALTANGNMSLSKSWNSEEDDNIARLYLQFFPNEEAYIGTDQIGWCTISDNETHGKYVEGRLLLRGPVIASILNELRLNDRQYVRIGGFENDKGNLVITSFDLSPRT